MPVHFEIKELGPLKNTSFEFYPFLLFSGESNMGKSYVGFLVYSFFKILNDDELLKKFVINHYNIEEITEKLLEGKGVSIDFHVQCLIDFANEELPNMMAYLSGNEDINCKVIISLNEVKKDIKLILSIPKESQEWVAINIMQPNSRRIGGANVNHLPNAFVDSIKHISYHYFRGFAEDFPQNFFLFSTGRGNLLTSSFTEKEKYASNLGMHKEFLYAMDLLLSPNYNGKVEQYEFLTQLRNEIFGGEVKNRDGALSYKKKDVNIPLKSAASSVKELSPLYFLLNKISPSHFSLLFEEPETHLHPNLQRKLANLLAYLVNEGAYLQITTHSDYMMQQWDFLIMLYYLKQKSPEKYAEIAAKTGLDEHLALNPEKVGAYIFEPREDGSVAMRKATISEDEVLPFDSFQKVIEEMSEQRYILTQELSS